MPPKVLLPAMLLALVLVCPPASAQPFDFGVEISEGGVPIAGEQVVYAMVVTADWWTDKKEPFTVTLTVPPGLEPISSCTGDLRFDAATRVLTWADRLDNEVIAMKSCPLLFRVDPSLVIGSAFTLTATLSTAGPDNNAANNRATIHSVVRASSDLEVTAETDVRSFRPGETVVYTFRVVNHGPHDAVDVSFRDDLPQQLSAIAFEQTGGPAAMIGPAIASIPLLRVGESATFRLTARAKTDFEAANIRNVVAVQSASVDVHPHNNELAHLTFAGPRADLASRILGTGDVSTAVIRVRNHGPDSVQNATLSIALSAADELWEFVDKARFVSLVPARGSCTEPRIVRPFGHNPQPAYWSSDCTLGALAVGEETTVTVVFESPRNGARLTSVAGPAQNDPAPHNNVAGLDAQPLRRRAARR